MQIFYSNKKFDLRRFSNIDGQTETPQQSIDRKMGEIATYLQRNKLLQDRIVQNKAVYDYSVSSNRDWAKGLEANSIRIADQKEYDNNLIRVDQLKKEIEVLKQQIQDDLKAKELQNKILENEANLTPEQKAQRDQIQASTQKVKMLSISAAVVVAIGIVGFIIYKVKNK